MGWRMTAGLRGLLVGLAFAGVCGFIVGLIGDLNGWWAGLAFTSNVLAGTTGACFGIPFAVLVLQRILLQDRAGVGRSLLSAKISPTTTVGSQDPRSADRRSSFVSRRPGGALGGNLVKH